MADQIKLIDDSLETAQADCLAAFQLILNRAIAPADPEMLLANTAGYLLATERAKMNYIVNAQLLAFATGAILEDKAGWMGGNRLPASFASTSIQFQIQPGAPDLVIPKNTRVKGQSASMYFSVQTDTTVTAGTSSIILDTICNTEGEAGNGFTAGTINSIMDPIPYVISAANIDTSTGGSDEETDDQLRARIPLLPSTFSVAGPSSAYIEFAKSANPSIIDVKLINNTDDGSITLYVLLKGGIVPNQSVLDQVEAACNPDKTRPINDVVNVAAPEVVNYSIDISLIKKKDATADVDSNAAIALQNYVNAGLNILGRDVIIDQIKSAVMVDGSYKCTVNSPIADIPIADSQYANCTSFKVTVTSIVDEQ